MRRAGHEGSPSSPLTPHPALISAVCLADLEHIACSKLPHDVFNYIASGAGDEVTLRRNAEAFRAWELHPRVLVDVSAVTTTTTILGRTHVSSPVLVAPLALQKAVHPEGEVATARAAAAAGAIMCVSTISTCSFKEISTAAPDGWRWFQLYALRDRGLTAALVQSAMEADFEALVLTVDTPVIGRRDRAMRTSTDTGPPLVIAELSALCGRPVTSAELARQADASLSWADLERLVADVPLPVIVKGILRSDDAVRACESGAAGIVVSNHGGRQLDGTPATIDVVAEIADAVSGHVEVLLDGGVRRGTDVLVALALGASAVLVGRPVLWSLAAAGEAGVRWMLRLIDEETRTALALVGASSPAELSRESVRRCPAPKHQTGKEMRFVAEYRQPSWI